MLFDEQKYKQELNDILISLNEDMKSIRTGRPNISTFDKIMVDYYGALTPVAYMAQISFSDAMTLTLKIHDKAMTKAVQDVIVETNIGGNVNQTEAGILKINFYPLTSEDRDQKVKELNEILENKRIRARQVRQKYMEIVKGLDKVSEDDQKRSQTSIQEILDEYVKKLETTAQEKQLELLDLSK